MVSLRGERRKEFPASVKRAAFARCCQKAPEGVRNIPGVPQCEGCGVELNPRVGIIYEHDDADGLGGSNTAENCKVHCGICAEIKTVTEDNPRMVKADRVAKAHYGLKKRRWKPMPGSKDSPFKRRMDGTVVKR